MGHLVRSSCVALIALSSCALEPGNPWGTISFEAQSNGALPASRLDAQGRWKTSSNYLIEVEKLRLTIPSLRMSLAAAGAADFDPANPPPGYSLCHNGHCHHDDGRLVDYEDIALELAGGAGAAGPGVTIPVMDGALSWREEKALTLMACQQGCEMPRGKWASLSAQLSSIELSLRIYDDSGTDRLPAEGLVVVGQINPELTLQRQLTGAFGPQEALEAKLKVAFRLNPKLFDTIAWSELSVESATAAVDLSGNTSFWEEVSEKLAEDTLVVERSFDN